MANERHVETVSGLVTVGIRDDGSREGNRNFHMPTIFIWNPEYLDSTLRLTWSEARELAEALLSVTALAERG